MIFGHKRGWEARQEQRRTFEKKFHQEKRARMAGLPVMGYSDGEPRGFAMDTSTGFSQIGMASMYAPTNSITINDYAGQMYRMANQYTGMGNTVIVSNVPGTATSPPIAPSKMETPERAPSLREVWAD